MRNYKEPKPLYRVGDWVTFPYGTIQPVARVIEDRGAIGHKGRRLYRIEFWFPKDVLHQFEMPEEEISAALPPHQASSLS